VTLLRGLLAFIAFYGCSQAVFADDVPFGADALGPLSKTATDVVVAVQPRRLAGQDVADDDVPRARYSAYAVKVDEVILGSLEWGAEIKVAIPESIDVARVDELSGAFLFIKRFAPDQLRQTNVAVDDAYLVVSGRYGVVDAAVPDRKAAVQAYLGSVRPNAARSENVLSWTSQYLQSSDPFLQHSAVVDLYFERKSSRAVQQLDEALRSTETLPASKQTAIEALGASKAPEAATALKDLAENNREHTSLRKQAVKAFGHLPGGEQQLLLWSGSGDRVLSPAAMEALRQKP
jgi:hypothetical protein